MLMHFPFLTTIIWLPIVGAIPILMCRDQHINKARWIGLLISVISLAVCILMIWKFDINSYHMQFREQVAWLPVLHINYDVGVDGISLPLVALTCFTTFIVVLASWTMVSYRVSQYLAAFMVMQGAVVGVFSSIDAILFYFFWEAMLIPMYLSIGIWGGPRRSYAAIKFFVYTFLGSALMLIALLYLGLHANSFSILDFYHLKMTLPVQIFVFLGFLLSFAIKVPMWPFHTWLPDAHTEAPTGGSVVLAALMLKLGAYGFLRFSLPITPDASHSLKWVMIALSLISIIYIGLVAIAQTDMKKLIAYSSISHMGFVTLGFFIFNAYGIEGALVQMVSHGFISAAMFLAVGVLYDRMHSRQIESYGGVANTMPGFAAFAVFFAMANSCLPGTSGFVGEFMVILGAIQVNFWYAFLAASTLIFGAAYTLWMVKRVFYGEIANPSVAALKDINKREFFILAILALLVLALGVYPQPLTDVTNA